MFASICTFFKQWSSNGGSRPLLQPNEQGKKKCSKRNEMKNVYYVGQE